MNHRNSSPIPVLLVDDEPDILIGAQSILESAGVQPVETLQDSRDVIQFLEKSSVSVLVLDLYMPHLSGLQLLPIIRKQFPEITIIVMTASQELDTAIACMKDGVFDYLLKPVDEDNLVSSIKKALEIQSLRKQVSTLKQTLLNHHPLHGTAFKPIITDSKIMQALFKYVTATAVTSEPILITGETGVGKELFAKAVHEASGRKGGFITINAAGLDDTVFTDTLFGHKKGAYTGAEKSREGMIAMAQGGTLFLDEIGDLSETSQVKLLRLLQERQYYPLGSDLPRKTDARIILATNKDLQKRIAQGFFRADLYYRLAVHEIVIPPLRDRIEDVPLLTIHFLEEAARSMGKPSPTPPKELFSLLKTHQFPGNIRELRAIIFDAVAQHESRMISMKPFRKMVNTSKTSLESDSGTLTLGEEKANNQANVLYPGRCPTLKESENSVIREALRRSDDNQGVAASLLGISRQALNRRLARMYTQHSES
jgi:two-component system, NtrC family, response regulator HydG